MEHAHVPQVLKPKDDLHQSIDSQLHNDVKPNRTSTDSSHQHHAEPLRKVNRPSGGSDRSAEQSPLHRNQARASWERRNSSEGTQRTAPNTPGRLKSRFGGRGDESPEKGTAVPKFGEWDEGNPSSADGFTQVFNQVREEKQTGSAKVPQMIDNSVPKNSYSQGGSYKSSSCCCFSWCKK